MEVVGDGSSNFQREVACSLSVRKWKRRFNFWKKKPTVPLIMTDEFLGMGTQRAWGKWNYNSSLVNLVAQVYHPFDEELLQRSIAIQSCKQASNRGIVASRSLSLPPLRHANHTNSI
ncbi:hypothetical protein CEXT_324701 [Caerostris extrusa]|uniref:Uncharacterized protein n=1 Tax=Caerostris extrusa TaxID=172846 RepID=A0AAV4R427_CAEEX|nr:hypothetical protein CEXT_324701 [Caerostris extrusa]